MPTSPPNIVAIGNRQFADYVIRNIAAKRSLQALVVPADELARTQAGFTPIENEVNDDIEIIRTNNINDKNVIGRLNELSPEICINVAWSQIFGPSLLDVPDTEFLGVHASELPQGRGGASVNWSLIHDADSIGISIFRVTQEVDDGPVFAQGSVTIQRRDTVQTIFDSLAHETGKLLLEVINDLANEEAVPDPQQIDDATYRPRRQPQDGLLNWNRDPLDQERFVRALTSPYPGAFTFYKGDKLFVWEARAVKEEPTEGAGGEVITIRDRGGIDIATGNGIVRLKRVQRGNTAPQWADEFARQADITLGDTLTPEAQDADWLYTGIRDQHLGTHYETNIVCGDTGVVTALLKSVGQERELTITAMFDNTKIKEVTRQVSGTDVVELPFTPQTTGKHTLTISFSQDGTDIDHRILKIYTK